MSWSRRFDDPIELPDGRRLETLRDAANYIMARSPLIQSKSEWQAAGEALLMAAEGRGPIMLADVGMRRALNAGKPDPKLAPRKRRAKTYRIVR